jgi:hypothetical protein
MTQGQINSIIDMTEGDTVLDSLLKLFNQGKFYIYGR